MIRSAIATTALACACLSPAIAHAQNTAPHAGAGAAEHNWEAGVAFGRDYDSDQNLWAFSLGKTFEHGYKLVFEYADGMHGHLGSKVSTLKVVKEVFRWGPAEFGLLGGGSYVKEAHANGWGAMLGVEAIYPLARNFAAKFEVSYLWGFGDISETRAAVVQAGLLYRF